MSSRSAILFVGFWLCTPLAGAQTLLFTVPGDASVDLAGTAVAMVGDVDADGAQDFAVGSPLNDANGDRAGMVRVYSGRTRLPLHTWFGSSTQDRLGVAVAGAGDIDGDLHDDVIVGAPGGNYARVFSGATGSALHHLTGTSGFGQSVAGGGLVDGDGVPDLLVGAPLGAAGGLLVVFSGASGAIIRSHPGGACADRFGWSAAFFGDVDGDGRHEYVVGKPLTIGGCGNPEVIAYDGATGAFLWSSTAITWNDQLGFALAPLADVNGDQIPDVLAGAPQDPGVGCGPCNGKGFVRLLDGLTGAVLWQVAGTGFYAGLGYALTAIGDIDGNGFEDFVASQPSTEGCDGNTQPLQVRDGQAGALLFQIPRPAPGDGFGSALASGDANADGLRDLLVGTPCDDAGGADSGATYVYTLVRDVTPYCEAKQNSQGCFPSMYATGVPSLTVGNFRARARDVINNKVGLLLWSRAPSAIPFQGAYLCLKPTIVRTSPQSSGGNPGPNDCSGAYAFQFTPVYMTSQGIQAGDQLYCQYWSRDKPSIAATGLTDALAFHVEP